MENGRFLSQEMSCMCRKWVSKVAETISVVAVSIAAFLTAINQISIIITTKQLWKQQQQLQQQLEMLRKELSE